MTATTTFDPQAFRQALGAFTTGVTIITCRSGGGEPVGMTANSFNSVSLDPPLVLWSLAKTSRSLEAYCSAECWNVHVLAADQEDLSGRFATKGEDKFAGLELDVGETPAPLLKGCVARFQCRTTYQYEGGDHIILVGEVLSFDKSNKVPLSFSGGRYALTTSKQDNLSLTDTTRVECNYSENLLGYLVGRANFQLLYRLRPVLEKYRLDNDGFFMMSVLSIHDGLSTREAAEFVAYTGGKPVAHVLGQLSSLGFVEQRDSCFFLTNDGRQASIEVIAAAKSVESDLESTICGADLLALKQILKRIILETDPGLPDLWSY